MKKILVTGGLGFIGFNFVKSLEKNEEWKIVKVVDKITYAAFPWLTDKGIYLEAHGIPLIKKDICELSDSDVEGVDVIVNFAGETHVDNSIESPSVFTRTNVLGVSNLLELTRKHNLRFHQIGTDEVYGSVNPEVDFVDENFSLNPSSPYSATKTAADLLTLSYYKTFGCNVTVSRCSNNFGAYQHREKFIPTVIDSALHDKQIPVYGDGLQKRFWIHVDDHNDAVLRILEFGRAGGIYNIAPTPKNLKTNLEIVDKILEILHKPSGLISHVKDRPGHDKCYYLEGNKILNECGFVPRSSTQFAEDLEKTVEWYCKNLQELNLKNFRETTVI